MQGKVRLRQLSLSFHNELYISSLPMMQLKNLEYYEREMQRTSMITITFIKLRLAKCRYFLDCLVSHYFSYCINCNL